MIHNSIGSSQNHKSKLPAGQQSRGPLLHVAELDVEAWRNHCTLIEPSIQLHNDLSGAMIINNFKFFNVAVLLHGLQELHNDLGAGTQEDLALSALFGVGDAFEAVRECADEDHFCGGELEVVGERVGEGKRMDGWRR